ncbi:MAG TPA: hypothetical protein PKH77_24980 [Anaerolineae bacterium]|nr:hypothetical protein [Anaerolineae bacterium]
MTTDAMEDETKRNDLEGIGDRIVNLGVAISTTARKYMDGYHSSVLYNAILLVAGDQWTQFLKRLIDGLDKGLSLRMACTAAIRCGTPAMNLIATAFKMMDSMADWRSEDDGPGWASMESGIRCCGGWPIKEESK